MRVCLEDHPKLFNSLVEQADAGRQLEDRPAKLKSVINDFQRMKAKIAANEEKSLLPNAPEDQQRELLRKYVEKTTLPKKSAG